MNPPTIQQFSKPWKHWQYFSDPLVVGPKQAFHQLVFDRVNSKPGPEDVMLSWYVRCPVANEPTSSGEVGALLERLHMRL